MVRPLSLSIISSVCVLHKIVSACPACASFATRCMPKVVGLAPTKQSRSAVFGPVDATVEEPRASRGPPELGPRSWSALCVRTCHNVAGRFSSAYRTGRPYPLAFYDVDW